MSPWLRQHTLELLLTSELEFSPVALRHQAYRILQLGFVVAPIVAGTDKFVHYLVDWDQYLAPVVDQILGGNGHVFMLAVGVIEIVAGIGVAIKPKVFAYVVAAWLLGIVINLLLARNFYDIALRNVGLALGALARSEAEPPIRSRRTNYGESYCLGQIRCSQTTSRSSRRLMTTERSVTVALSALSRGMVLSTGYVGRGLTRRRCSHGLLDADRGGYWRIAPDGSFRVERRYLQNTNVLETRFAQGDGEAVLTDLMPVVTPDGTLRAEQELLRRVECTAGSVRLRSTFEPRPELRTETPRITDRGRFGVFFQSGPCVFNLRSDAPLRIDGPAACTASCCLTPAHAVNFSFTLTREGPVVFPPLGDQAQQAWMQPMRWWQRWAGRCRYDGPYRDQVVRSALALKLMIYAPSGAMIAAPTTSLPERLGGDLNWDYRFCWLRDAAFTARALFGLGYREEAEAFVSWMLHATRLTRPELRVIYDVFGESNPTRRSCPTCEATPVRARSGSGTRPATSSSSTCTARSSRRSPTSLQRGGELDRETQKMLRHFGEYVCRHWHEPDNGIWEPRNAAALHALAAAVLGGPGPAPRNARAGPAPRHPGGRVHGAPERDSPGHRGAGLEPGAGELHPGARRGHARRDRAAPGLPRVRRGVLAADAADVPRIQERLGAGRGCSTATSRASRGRGRVRDVLLLDRRVPGPRGREPGGGARTPSHRLGLRQRPRPVRRGDRPEDRRRAGQLPAGVHPRRPHQRRAVAGGAGRARASEECEPRSRTPPKSDCERLEPEVRR